MAKPYQIKLRRTTQTIDTTSDGWTTPSWWKSAQGDTAPVEGEPIVITSGNDKLLAIGDGTDSKPKFFKAFRSKLLNQFTFWESANTGTFTGARVQLKDENNNALNPYTTAGSVGYSTTEEDLPPGTVGASLSQLSSDISSLQSKDTNRPKMWYGICAVAAATQAKTVTQPNMKAGGTFTSDDLKVGCMIRVLFTNGNTVASPTLNVVSTGAKPIWKTGATNANAYYISPNEVVDFVYDGTNFNIVNKGTATTDYYGVTKLSNTYTSSDATVAASQKAVYDAYSALNTNTVKTSGDQTITGTKTFSGTVVLPTNTTAVTQTSTDNSTKVATTAFVKTATSKMVTTDGAQTISSVKTFSAAPKISATIASTSNDTTVATTAFVKTAINTAIENVQIAPYIGSTAPSNRNLLWVKTISATVNGTAVTEYVLHVCTNPTSTATAVWVPVSSIW